MVCSIYKLLFYWLGFTGRISFGSGSGESCNLEILCGADSIPLYNRNQHSVLAGRKTEQKCAFPIFYHAVPMLWLWLFSAFINTAMQEPLVRGYLYQMIKSNYNVIAAAVVSSSLFTLLHGGAFEAGIIPVLNVLTMSFLMTKRHTQTI